MANRLRENDAAEVTLEERVILHKLAEIAGVNTYNNEGWNTEEYLFPNITFSMGDICGTSATKDGKNYKTWMTPVEFAFKILGCEPIIGITLEELYKHSTTCD
jgi:hypothetical protein